jgi:hydroxypyruvate reductase
MIQRIREDILLVVQKAIAAADPAAAVARHVSIDNTELTVGDRTFDLSCYERVLALGAGKASMRMARALEKILEDRLTVGAISTTEASSMRTSPCSASCLEIFTAEHPVPGISSLAAAERAMEIAGTSGARDLVFCLISGGASSLWALPAGDIDIGEIAITNELLLACGANIHEINTIRKHISKMKGGRLAQAVYPGTLITLAISDVVSDKLSSIGSGPTVADPSTFDQALAIVDLYLLGPRLPPSVLEHLRNGAAGRIEETPKPGDPVFAHALAVIAASNRLALEAAAAEGKRLGYETQILSREITGEARDAGRALIETGKRIVHEHAEIEQPVMLISGGETTVTIRGGGEGGRNQELALSAAIAMADSENMVIASVGTDGIDGNTEAAGAFADGATVKRAQKQGLEALSYLEDNNSYYFFDELGDLIRTGPTGTNVMDIQVIVYP